MKLKKIRVDSFLMISVFSFIYQISKPYFKWYFLICIGPISTGIYAAFNNYAIKVLIDSISGNIVNYSEFLKPLLIFTFAQVIKRALWSLHDYGEYKIQSSVFKDIILQPYEYLQNHSYKFFQENFSGALVSRIKGLSDGLYAFWDVLSHKLLTTTSIIVCNMIMIFTVDPRLLTPVLLYVAIFGTTSYFQGRRNAKLAFITRQSYHQILGRISDKISNIFTIFSFATKKREIEDIDKFYQSHSIPAINKINYFNFISWLIFGTLSIIITLLIFLYMIYLRKNNIITTGTLTSVILVMIGCFYEIDCLMKAAISLIQNLADFRTSLNGIYTKQEIIDIPNAQEIKINTGEIIFKNVNFQYEDNIIFEELNLHIKAGEKIGIVGHSGAGKSTLISLLLKNFKASTGDIIIDNQSIYNCSSHSLRSQIALIPQDTMLFHRNIYENIGYGKDNATQEEIEHAAKMANIHDFILTLPEQYNTLVGERGVKLSGGQRQRIAIARAILKNAPVLILDEATSALDSETEQTVQKSIQDMLNIKNATIIAIAHRLSTIKHLDRIIILENGRIIEDDTFHNLLALNNGKFKEMWDRQVNGMLV